MNSAVPAGTAREGRSRIAVVAFGIGMATFVLYLVTFRINVHTLNDFYREAWPPYRLLAQGNITGFLRKGPAYIGSLVLRAPLALLASAFGAGPRATYVATALPCMFAPAFLAGWLTATPLNPQGPSSRRGLGLRPLDLFMLTPQAIVCAAGGHPEEVLGAVLCVAAVLLAVRGSGRTAGVFLGLALINKFSAVVAVPLVFAVLPANRRLAALATLVVTVGVVMVPVTAIRAASAGSAGSALGTQTVGIFLPPQLLWWFGSSSWIVAKAHILLVVAAWAVTGAWWWLRVHGRTGRPQLQRVLMALALVFFLRCALDPWDNIYYYTPFMLTLATIEQPAGFPKLTWTYVVLLVVVVSGVLDGLGHDGRAAVFTAFALITIAYFAWRAFSPGDATNERVYPTATGAGA